MLKQQSNEQSTDAAIAIEVGMDGLELLREVKQKWPELAVMMVTAYGDDERRRRADELGATDFLAKPVDFDALKVQLRQLPTAAN